MSKIIIILLLSAGVFASIDQVGAETIKQDETNNDELKTTPATSETDMPNEKPITDTNTEPVKLKPKTKKAPVLLDKEQINMLAEKVIRIHGVELGSDDEENQKNIHSLRNLVSNVEKNLNEKLKLSQARKANLNAEDKITGDKIESSATNQNETPKESLENASEVENNDKKNEEIKTGTDDAEYKSSTVQQLDENQAETEESNENIGTQSDVEADVDNSKSANDKSNKNEEINVNNPDENKQKENVADNIDKSNIDSSDAAAEASETEDMRLEADTSDKEKQNINEDATEEDIVVKTAEDIQTDINKNTEPEPSVVDDVRSEADAINLDIEIDKDNIIEEEVVTETPAEDQTGIADDTNAKVIETEDVQFELEENEYEDTVEEKTEEPAEYEAEQNHIDDDTDEKHTEPAEKNESDVTNIEEDEISGACSLNDECDQADTRKIHAYSEEYNSEKVAEQELEVQVEDSHLQRLIKFVTSIF